MRWLIGVAMMTLALPAHAQVAARPAILFDPANPGASFETANNAGMSAAWRDEAHAYTAILREDWVSCLIKRRDLLAKSREPAETVATAILAGCTTEASLLEKATASIFFGLQSPSERAETAAGILRRGNLQFREALIAFIVEARAR